jgi:hypothetical protein
MRLYKHPHRFYCGIDLHARTLYLHVLDHGGKTRYEKNIPARPDTFLDAVEPRRPSVARLSMPWTRVVVSPSSFGSRARRQERPPNGTEMILRRTRATKTESLRR